MIAHHKKFSDIRVVLDGSTFVGCTFERCVLIYSGALPTSLNNNKFSDCSWEFDGAAQNTLGFMAALYSGGGRELIEKTFENIRNNATGQRRAGDTIVLN